MFKRSLLISILLTSGCVEHDVSTSTTPNKVPKTRAVKPPNHGQELGASNPKVHEPSQLVWTILIPAKQSMSKSKKASVKSQVTIEQTFEIDGFGEQKPSLPPTPKKYILVKDFE